MFKKLSFYLILTLSMSTYQSHSSIIDHVHMEYNQRCDKFKVANNQEECKAHTNNINRALRDETKVDQKRHATLAEAKIILQAVMGTAIIHQRTLYSHDSSPFNKKPKLSPSTILSKHFEILLLTEKFACEQYSYLASNMSTFVRDTQNEKLKNISLYSGIAKEKLIDWFLETCRSHGMEIITIEKTTTPNIHTTSATSPLPLIGITATAAPPSDFRKKITL